MDKPPVLRVARPTDHLPVIKRMYVDGLGFRILSEFANHEGFDGAILGHPKWPYHVEFTRKRGHTVDHPADPDHLLVFYIPEKQNGQNYAGK